jgi:hypothetical protein
MHETELQKMAVQVTHRRMSSGGWSNQHITDVKWRDPSDGNTGQASRKDMVDWINRGGEAYVLGPRSRGEVGVVKANPPYLRTYTDGDWTDTLLFLPIF